MRKRRMRNRVLHKRVIALHRAFENQVSPMKESNSPTEVEELETAHPQSLDYNIRKEVERFRRQHSAGRELLTEKAMEIAKNMAHRENHPLVLARFGVERAVDEMARSIHSLTENLPRCFVNGVRLPSMDEQQEDWSCLGPNDLHAIQRISIPLLRIQWEGVFPARWHSQQNISRLTADPIRPPMEALALSAAMYRATRMSSSVGLSFPAYWGSTTDDLGSKPSILCVGMGIAGAAQALSALLPHYYVHHQASPYYALVVPRQSWDAIFVNLPAPHHWRVARYIGEQPDLPYLKRRAILQKRYSEQRPNEHVESLLRTATRHRVSGKALILMGDREQHHEAVLSLRHANMVAPLIVGGIDTSKRPVWVGYDKSPWAPHGLPSPTGKLVSIWRWK